MAQVRCHQTNTLSSLPSSPGSLVLDGRPATDPDQLLQSAKWFLWHGNVRRAVQRLDTLIELLEHDDRLPSSPERSKLAWTLNELYDYLDTNRDLIPDYGDRHRHGEAISSSIAESIINQVVGRRFVKKQQMRWLPETAHLLLQVRTRTQCRNQ